MDLQMPMLGRQIETYRWAYRLIDSRELRPSLCGFLAPDGRVAVSADPEAFGHYRIATDLFLSGEFVSSKQMPDSSGALGIFDAMLLDGWVRFTTRPSPCFPAVHSFFAEVRSDGGILPLRDALMRCPYPWASLCIDHHRGVFRGRVRDFLRHGLRFRGEAWRNLNLDH